MEEVVEKDSVDMADPPADRVTMFWLSDVVIPEGGDSVSIT